MSYKFELSCSHERRSVTLLTPGQLIGCWVCGETTRVVKFLGYKVACNQCGFKRYPSTREEAQLLAVNHAGGSDGHHTTIESPDGGKIQRFGATGNPLYLVE